ncbi:MAG TPA: hypothetical protein VGJ82_00040 [Thermoanaerobaculia bacterium]|jgi:hypothetical protein
MFDLERELDAVRTRLSANGIRYALCGGLAVGVYGFVRATVDIDLLIQAEDEERVYEAVSDLDYSIKARPMNFDNGATRIRRISKVDPTDGEVLMLDLLLLAPEYQHVWDTRRELQWNGRELWVVSPQGLIALKKSRSSAIDLADIEKLEKIR